MAQARAVAGGKDVDIFSPGIGQQALRAGLVDEVRIHLVPVLLGARLFGDIGHDHVQLKITEVIEEPKATHLRYAVVRS